MLGSALKGERLQFWRGQAHLVYHVSMFLACISSYRWRYITISASIGRPEAANHVA
jgi:hypothetical protein